ncbi:MAG: RNA polymerase subunit sigma-70 [Nitratireductor sp.]|nr:RNA polymerase subunit sigma-70 [Nitratireductor sp.]
MSTLPDTSDVARIAEAAARASYGKLVAILAHRTRDIAAAEDALSDALVSALATWPRRGVPENPEAWLLTAARNLLKNSARAGHVRRAAEPEILLRNLPDEEENGFPDRRLRLLFVCAHPAIHPAVHTPLMLQSVLGIDATRIAHAFLVEPAAMSQRLVRAKARIRDAGLRFELPGQEDLEERLAAVLDAVYAAFGRGWEDLDQPETPDALTGEAIWLARLLVALMPGEPEPKGLLALMLYCSARRPARRDAAGNFVPLDQQDARLWNRNMIVEAEGLLTQAAQAGRFGRFQCEAAIQSVHVQRPITGQVNFDALVILYNLLVQHTDNIGARIGRAVVLAERGGTAEALAELDALKSERVARHQPYWVARARVALLADHLEEAESTLETALSLTQDPALRAHLQGIHRQVKRRRAPI